MTEYEFVSIRGRSFETDENVEVIAAGYDSRNRGESWALLRLPEDDDSSSERVTCAGNGGDCSRSVDEEGGLCWQHANNEE